LNEQERAAICSRNEIVNKADRAYG